MALPVTGEIDNETATKIEATLGKLILENDAAYDTAVKEIQKLEKRWHEVEEET